MLLKGFLSWLLFPDMDENILAAITEYRADLFAISRDRKVKLRQTVLEQTAHQDVTNWAVPARRVNDERRELEEKVARAISGEKSGCYCSKSDSKILTDIIGESVPDEALILAHCWIRICEVRGPDLTSIPPEVWSELCRRAVIKRRENPHASSPAAIHPRDFPRQPARHFAGGSCIAGKALASPRAVSESVDIAGTRLIIICVATAPALARASLWPLWKRFRPP